MTQMIFVNLPVKDLAKTTAFYEGLGLVKNLQFSDDNASSLVLSDTIVFMLLSQEYFKSFLVKEPGDPTSSTSSLFAISRESREEVDAFAEKALATGATAVKEPQDYGFMYQRSFIDPDGQHIEVMWMDPATVQG